MNITFWGVRGSTPCPCDTNRRYGGNTACVSVEAPGMDPIVLDLGTGLRFWGETFQNKESFRGLALVTHLHWDHVQGLPFFVPINQPGARLQVLAPLQDDCSVADMFEGFMRPPYFPVRAADLAGEIDFRGVRNVDLAWGPASVKVRDVPHIGPTNGYRIEVGDTSIAYISDHQQPTEHDGVADSVLELCDGVDLLIHDAQYNPAEFLQKSNWGHCTVGYAVRVAAESGARRLALFHHDPGHADVDIDRLLLTARAMAGELGVPEVLAASEGMTVVLAGDRVVST